MSEYFPSSVRWLTEEVYKLIELVQQDEAIYNPRHKYYFCRPYVENFWREVDQKLDKNPGASLAKWTNLRISFRREFTNYLEEQVPPCWTYFDRMFFLHPYLRKKQQQQTPKPGETLQENTANIFAQITELSQRLERRSAKDSNKSPTSPHRTQSISNEQPLSSNADPYFDYYDEPEHNTSELEEIIEEERHKIKSECEDEVREEEYESQREIDTDTDTVDEITVANSSKQLSTNARIGNKRLHQQLRLEHLNRIQTRTYHEDLRAAKCARSQDRVTSGNSQNLTTTNGASTSQRSSGLASSSLSSNISFVRPTFSKIVDPTLSTNNNILSNDNDSTLLASSLSSLSHLQQQQSRFNAHSNHHNQRSENINSLSTTITTANSVNNNSNSSQTTRQLLSPSAAVTTPHIELCDCKTDPDAMFLMSLLPDIQKLNGRDRGKIKIAFQNILQDYLYPD